MSTHKKMSTPKNTGMSTSPPKKVLQSNQIRAIVRSTPAGGKPTPAFPFVSFFRKQNPYDQSLVYRWQAVVYCGGSFTKRGEVNVKYKDDYTFGSSIYDDEDEQREFIVTQERTILVQYTVEAQSMVDAIQQIEHGNYDCVIDEDASHADTDKKGRIISVRVNDDD